jgi:hypothetical protein
MEKLKKVDYPFAEKCLDERHKIDEIVDWINKHESTEMAKALGRQSGESLKRAKEEAVREAIKEYEASLRDRVIRGDWNRISTEHVHWKRTKILENEIRNLRQEIMKLNLENSRLRSLLARSPS